MPTVIGQAVLREDAIAKATGIARYSTDRRMAGLCHAVLVTSTIARGRVDVIDSRAAEALPGVRLVLTHKNLARRFAPDKGLNAGERYQSSVCPLSSNAIAHYGQIVAIVVADTIELAEHAASLLRVSYTATPAQAELGDAVADATPLPKLGHQVGDAQAAFDRAEIKVDAHYHTPAMFHNAIELYGVTANWQGDQLQLDVPTQWVIGTQRGVAQALGIAAERVTVTSPLVGGAFGGKASILWHVPLIAVAAQRIGRPVRLVVSRAQGFTVASFRPESTQHVQLAADRQGKLQAYLQEGRTQASRHDVVSTLGGSHYSAHVYDVPHIRTREYSVARDVNTPGFMRGPSEYPCNFAQESALDELALALNLDPVALRVLNEPQRDPVNGQPYSGRGLVQCYRRGAQMFGWDRRQATPGSMRTADGQRIGWGCATSWYPYLQTAGEVGLRIDARGRVQVQVASLDMGTGASTILAQIVADYLGVALQDVSVQLGHSSLPHGPMVSGSSGTATLGSAARQACRQARDALLDAATALTRFQATDRSALQVTEGRVVGADGTEVSIGDLVARRPDRALQVRAWSVPGQLDAAQLQAERAGFPSMIEPFGHGHTMYSYGAIFAEVFVDPVTRRIRLGRLVGVFDCGRVINPRTARSQLVGGMIWGASHALMEEGMLDKPSARYANTDLGGYHFAANADIADVLVEMLDEPDYVANALGAKGVGELGVIGVAPAIANAVAHATGVRVRKTPLLVDDLLGEWV